MRQAFVPVLLSLPVLLLLASPVPAQDSAFAPLRDEYVAKIATDLDTKERLSLVSRVAARGDRDAAKLLIDSLEKLSGVLDDLLREHALVDAAHEEVNSNQDLGRDKFKKRTALRAELMALDEKIIAHRSVMNGIRDAAVKFASAGARGYVESIATRGKAWRQRGIAAFAAAQYPTDSGRSAALKALKDKEPRVVIQCLYGLKVRKDLATATAIAACLKDDVWVVKSAAADALAEMGAKKAVRALIEAIPKADGRVRHDINDALKKLTGQKFAPDYEAWKAWYEEHKEEYEGEGAKPLARKRGGGTDPDDSSYYGIPAKSKRIVYVIDISGSMLKEIGGKGTSTPRPGERERPSGAKIEIAKKELKNAIRKLPEDAWFNIITFNHIVKRWSKTMLKATQKNKNKAYLFIRELKAEGSTFTYGALKDAFKLAGMGARDPNYDSGVDTIFLLSDGAPTDQSFPLSKLMEPEKILKAVREWNSLTKVIIHAIAIDPQTQGGAFIKFMKQLADQNGGEYLERG